MRVVVQRVSSGRVVIDGDVVGAIDAGLVVFVGIEAGDGDEHLRWMADKLSTLRVFEDADGKMNLGPSDAGAALLIVPNFTVAGDCKKGRRPSFDGAMAPGEATVMFDRFVGLVRASGLPVETGRFGAEMHVSLTSDGPITLVLERRD